MRRVRPGDRVRIIEGLLAGQLEIASGRWLPTGIFAMKAAHAPANPAAKAAFLLASNFK